MQKYDSYKDSGIFWQPQIPNNWIVKKLGYVLKKHNRPRPLGAELLVCTNKATVIKKGDSKMGMISENEEIYQGVAVGDLLIHGMDTWHGAIAISKYDGMCTPVVHVCTSEEDVAYISYYLRNMATQKVFKLISNGVRQNTSDFRGWDKVKEILCPIPPLPEQQAIASYLDTATAKIDEAIAQQQKMIDLLNERKQIIINNAVTKGLNPNAKMKPSGIDWIGNIPEHWEVRKLKQIAKLRSGDTISSDQFTTSGFPVFGGNGFRGYTDRYTNEGNYVLIGRQGALCGNVNYADGKFFATEHAVVVYPHSSENVIWLGECIKASNLNQYSQSAAQPGLAVSVIGNVSYPYPPTEERDSIAEYIRQNTERLDCSINNATKQIALLQERKQIIINDVVTGKVKVV